MSKNPVIYGCFISLCRDSERRGRRGFIGFASLFICLAVAAEPIVAEPIVAEARAIDGGTIAIGETRYALHGIIAPPAGHLCREWVARRQRDYPCGVHAHAVLASLLADRRIACVAAAADGRTRCYADGRDIGEAMVAAGWAIADEAASNLYLTAQERARSAQRGLWAGTFELGPVLRPTPARSKP